MRDPPRSLGDLDASAGGRSSFRGRPAVQSLRGCRARCDEDSPLELAHGLRSVNRMDAAAARDKLVTQHDQLRAELARCKILARRLREGELVHAELDAALAQLRFDFAEHNTTETELVRPLMQASARGRLLVGRMLEEHIGEHAAFWEMLAGSAVQVAANIDDLVEQLDAHMAAEERTFLSPIVLCKGAISS
jgi:iron-sulfur cluster repair protein YtfE (RIC family)